MRGTRHGWHDQHAQHCTSWIVKIATGAGQTASPALNNLAKNSTTVEARAAENFGKAYKKLQKKLGLSGTEVTVGEVTTCGRHEPVP